MIIATPVETIGATVRRQLRPGISIRLTTQTRTPPRRLTKGALLGVEETLDALRQLIARTAASVYATEDLFQKFIWDDRIDERDEERRIEHLSHLIDTTRETVVAAVEMARRSRRAVQAARRPRGEAVNRRAIVKIGVVSDDVLRLLAADLGLDQAATESKGRTWWRTMTTTMTTTMTSTKNGVIVVVAGPHQGVASTGDAPEKRSLPTNGVAHANVSKREKVVASLHADQSPSEGTNGNRCGDCSRAQIIWPHDNRRNSLS